MIASNNRKSYRIYLNELVDQCNNPYHHYIDKKNLLILIILLWLKKNETTPKASKFKFYDRVRIIKYKNIFSKGYTENWSLEIFIIDSVLKTNPWTYKIEDESWSWEMRR